MGSGRSAALWGATRRRKIQMRKAAFLVAIVLLSAGSFEGYGDADRFHIRGRELWSVPPTEAAEDGDKNWSVGTASRYCVPTLYTFGNQREIITDCDGAGGTELTPTFNNEDGEEVAPEDIQVQPIVVTREDVQSLIVEPGNLTVQPAQPWVLVNTDTVVMTDATEHVLGAEVLGVDVDVRVTPVVYTWDFGDGSMPVTGTDPGAPWPNHTVSHRYRTAGSVTISLRTEWDAAFRVEGTSGWVPVVGRAVTSQTADPIEVVTATPRLTTD